MQRIVDCRLIINSEIDNKKDSSLIEGRGYFKEEGNSKTVYFSSSDNKYKFVYCDNILSISFNESVYNFECNKQGNGIIKSGNLCLEITTYTYNLSVCQNSISVEYSMIQNDVILGKYKCELSFK